VGWRAQLFMASSPPVASSTEALRCTGPLLSQHGPGKQAPGIWNSVARRGGGAAGHTACLRVAGGMRLDLEVRTLVYFEGSSFTAPLRQIAPLSSRSPSCTTRKDHCVSPTFRAQSPSPRSNNGHHGTICCTQIQLVSIHTQWASLQRAEAPGSPDTVALHACTMELGVAMYR